MRSQTILRVVFLLSLTVTLIHTLRSEREATLTVTIKDAQTDRPTPVRVRLTDAAGKPPRASKDGLTVSREVVGIPAEAIGVMYGRYDRAEGFVLQPDGSFYVDGSLNSRWRRAHIASACPRVTSSSSKATPSCWNRAKA